MEIDQTGALVSRFSGLDAGSKRKWTLALIVFFVILFGAVGFSQWWAYNVNVPAYMHHRTMHT